MKKKEIQFVLKKKYEDFFSFGKKISKNIKTGITGCGFFLLINFSSICSKRQSPDILGGKFKKEQLSSNYYKVIL